MSRYFPGKVVTACKSAYHHDMGRASKPEEWPDAISRVIVRAAGRLGITEGEYARRLGFSNPTALSGVKNGSRPIGLEKLADAAKSAGYTRQETYDLCRLWLGRKLQGSDHGVRHLAHLAAIEDLGGLAAAVPYWQELIRDEAEDVGISPEDCGLHPLKGAKSQP